MEKEQQPQTQRDTAQALQKEIAVEMLKVCTGNCPSIKRYEKLKELNLRMDTLNRALHYLEGL